MTFDPYQQWLGVAPHEQPADAYRLLGIPRFESDSGVIDQALRTRLQLVQPWSRGPHAADAERLIREIEKAAATLRDPSAKSRYDMMLQLTYPAATAAPTESPPPAEFQKPSSAPQTAPTTPVDSARVRPSPKPQAVQESGLAPHAASSAQLPVGAAAPLSAPVSAASHATETPTPIGQATVAASNAFAAKPRRGSFKRQLPVIIACGVGALLLGLATVAFLFQWFTTDPTIAQVEPEGSQTTSTTGESQNGGAPPSPAKPSQAGETTSSPGSDSTGSSTTGSSTTGASTTGASTTGASTIGSPGSASSQGGAVGANGIASRASAKSGVATSASPSSATSKGSPSAGARAAAAPTKTSRSTPAAKPTKPQGPFDAWPDALPLPSLLVEQSQTLAPLEIKDGLELELNDEHADLEDGEITLRALDAGRWVVESKSGSSSAPTELANFHHRDGRFDFQWTEGAPVDVAKQLTNCVLHIAAGAHSKIAQLRASVDQSAFQISLEKKLDLRPLPVSNLPSLDQIELHVEPLEAFPVSGDWRNGQLKAELGKYVSIVLTDYPGNEIRFKVDRKGGDQLALFVSPIYRPNARVEMDFSMDRLDKMEQATRKSLISSQRDLVRTNARLNGLNSRKRSVDSMPASTVFQRQAKATAQYEVNRDLTTTKRKIASLKVRIPEMESLLKSLPEGRKAIAKIHLLAHVKLSVKSVGENDEITLYSARAASNETN